MIREAEALLRKQRFLLCRYILILVTGALGVLQANSSSPMPIVALVLLALVSNLYLATVSPFSFFDATMQAPILVTDTAMVSAVLLVSRASQEFFLFFFFVLIMAAKIENLIVLLIGAFAIGIASLLLSDMSTGLASPVFMRIPFMLATALFYGYVVLPERSGQMTPMSFGSGGAIRLPRSPTAARPQIRA
ncbi:MAG: hypothetical protein A3J75_08145 [Acidobacteria bacterium RBG_16_68_9]|nr:MAG: hypothetical protein A3J75_08145 [Acidobacteria bacterium RBG_16_68_9]